MMAGESQGGRRRSVAVVIHDLGPGGSQRVASVLARAWQRQGRGVSIITFADESSDFFQLEPGIGRISVGMPLRAGTRVQGLIHSLRRIVLLRRAIRATGAAAIVAFLPVSSILSIIAAAGLKRRVIISERNDPSRQILPWPWEQLRRRLYRAADMVIVNSRGAIDALRSFVPHNRLHRVPNPLVIPAADRRHDYTTHTILSVGRLTYQKAYDILLAAFAHVSASHPDWQLALIGEGPLRQQLQRQAEQLGIAGKVQWLGRVDDPFPCYRGADIFVLASRFEGLPNALLEAMGCGLPVVVSSASPGLLEHVAHEINGLVVAAENVGALSSALDRLIRDRALRKRLGQSARTSLEECSLEAVVRQWDYVLDDQTCEADGAGGR
jgi:glycosyltransferase involved in cell wall biosynthesis